jgi:hypothetical protein
VVNISRAGAAPDKRSGAPEAVALVRLPAAESDPWMDCAARAGDLLRTSMDSCFVPLRRKSPARLVGGRACVASVEM